MKAASRELLHTWLTLCPFRPPDGAGCDLPAGLLPLEVSEDLKPETHYRLWPLDAVIEWMASERGDGVSVPDPVSGMEVEERVHVALDDRTGTSKERHLFTTQGLVFAAARRSNGLVYSEWSLLARVRGGDASSLSGLVPFGGEGRLAYLETVASNAWPAPPKAVAQRLQGAKHVRMLLVTPGVFTRGWRPGWLGDDLQGTPPGVQGVRLQLVAAAVPRREAVSGWDYQTGRPKAVRWLVPAGAVYFLRVVRGDATDLSRQAWLEPVSDGEQDRRDGYGLALWGIWEPGGSV